MCIHSVWNTAYYLKKCFAFSSPLGKSRQHERDIDLFSKCTKGIARGSEERDRVGQVPGKQSRRWIIYTKISNFVSKQTPKQLNS